MKTKIAELIVDVPKAGDLVSRCREYLCDEKEGTDIVLRTDLFRENAWQAMDADMRIYMESGTHFYGNLLRFNGMMLHASAVELNGRAYLFSGNCGAGKSTHTRLWQQVFGQKARVFNDDKPALRLIEGRWIAYGTPWCGKDGININMCAPVAGICFMKQGQENRIRRLSHKEAVQRIIQQTIYHFKLVENLDLMLSHVDKLVRMLPVYELENRPEPEAVYLSYETMRVTAEEMGL